MLELYSVLSNPFNLTESVTYIADVPGEMDWSIGANVSELDDDEDNEKFFNIRYLVQWGHNLATFIIVSYVL